MTVAVALVVNVASLVVMFRLHRDAAAPTRMRHFEHPEKPEHALCGADVIDVREVAGTRDVDCVVCADLRRSSRRSRS